MARFQLKLPTEYMERLNSLDSNADEILKRAVYVGAGIVADAMKAKLLAVHTPRTGALVGSMGIASIKEDGDGWNTKIGFDGEDSKRVANVLKARVLDSGSSRQRARPFIRPALNSSRSAAKAAMTAEIEQQIANIMN